jgi:hypothetical protein
MQHNGCVTAVTAGFSAKSLCAFRIQPTAIELLSEPGGQNETLDHVSCVVLRRCARRRASDGSASGRSSSSAATSDADFRGHFRSRRQARRRSRRAEGQSPRHRQQRSFLNGDGRSVARAAAVLRRPRLPLPPALRRWGDGRPGRSSSARASPRSASAPRGLASARAHARQTEAARFPLGSRS